MKKILMALVVIASSLALVAPEAEARRMGGGRMSFGKQSQSFKRAAPPQSSPTNAAKPATPAGAGAAGAARPSMWKGMMGGALLGLGLGALLSHFGIGGALASMISTLLMLALFAFVIMFIIRMIRSKQGGNTTGPYQQPAFSNGYGDSAANKSLTPEIGSGITQKTAASVTPIASGMGEQGSHQNTNQVPDDFDVPAFVRNAKTYFIRLQAAWDKADINDIRDFTTPEMFAELRLQLQERGDAGNHTDVVSLDGELYGVETVGDEYIASIKFSGMIREEEGAAAEPFTEAWNLTKPVHGNGGWVLAGIQQLP